jgi:hypothetical protein
VGTIRLIRGEEDARGPHILGGETLGNARAVTLHPLAQALLRAHDHGLDVPERIVEVEGDRPDGAEQGPWLHVAYSHRHGCRGEEVARAA